MRLSQGDLADLLDVTRSAVSKATKEGHKVDGYPVRAWAIFDGAGRVSGYDVPKRVFERSNPSGQSQLPTQAGNGEQITGIPDVVTKGAEVLAGSTTNWPEAVAQTAGPVTGNVGATSVGMKALDTVREQPSLMEDVVDAGVTLLSGAIVAHATDENTSYRGMKVAGTMIGVFAAFKLLRGSGRERRDDHETAVRGGLPPKRQADSSEQSRLTGADPESRARGEARSRRNGASATSIGSH